LIDKAKLWDECKKEGPKMLELLKRDPAVVHYLLKDFAMKQKYLKLSPDWEAELKSIANKLGISEADLMSWGLFNFLEMFKKDEGKKK